MNRAALENFAKASARSIRDLYGSTVTIGGRAYKASVSTGQPSFDLNTGGFRDTVTFTVRVTKEDMPTAPASKTPVLIDGKTLRVMAVRKSFSPLAQEWVIDVENP